MEGKLEAWIHECINNGTFRNIDDAIEFCVGATRAFCEYCKINQESITKDLKEEVKKGVGLSFIEFPIKWSDELEAFLKSGSVTSTVDGDIDIIRKSYKAKGPYKDGEQ